MIFENIDRNEDQIRGSDVDTPVRGRRRRPLWAQLLQLGIKARGTEVKLLNRRIAVPGNPVEEWQSKSKNQWLLSMTQ